MLNQYERALQRLYRITMFNKKGVGLVNMTRLYESLGFPLNGMKVVHITGTNGKGSVSVKIADVLRRCGLKVGLFTSPHISSFRERIQVNNILIPEDDVVKYLNQVHDNCDRLDIPATFFEIVTGVSCLHFQHKKCDVAVVEVGIGGRLDSTNVINSALSIITAVQMDHAHILGNTVEAITTEKCGIFKRRSDAIIAPGVPLNIAAKIASENQTTLHQLSDILNLDSISHKIMPSEHSSTPGILIPDDPDKLNTDIARAGIELLFRRFSASLFRNIPRETIMEAYIGLQSRPPCRFEVIRVKSDPGIRIVLDIAHNEAAITTLMSKLNSEFPNATIRMVFGMCTDKDIPSCVNIIARHISPDQVHCVQANQPRAMQAKDLSDLVSKAYLSCRGLNVQGIFHNSIHDALTKSLQLSGIENIRESGVITETSKHSRQTEEPVLSVIIVCGSTFLMSEARKTIGISDVAEDNMSMNAPSQLENTLLR